MNDKHTGSATNDAQPMGQTTDIRGKSCELFADVFQMRFGNELGLAEAVNIPRTIRGHSEHADRS